jgi:hypothetical protein
MGRSRSGLIASIHSPVSVRRIGMLATAAITLAIQPSIAVAQATPPRVVLAPHKAVYDFSLARAAGGGISEMNGRMVYELTGSWCDGYTQSMRFVTRGATADGTTAVNDLRTSSTEDTGAQMFKFTSSQYQDDKLSETTIGDAERGKDGVNVALKKPAPKTVALNSDVLFPIQHSIQLIEAAQRSETLFQADLYDGSDKGEKVFATTAVIGKIKAAGHNGKLAKVANTDKLDIIRSWPIAMSYFDPTKQTNDAVPSYELGFLFFENGVARQLTMDYGDFALKGDLTQITFTDATPCDGKKK